MQRGVGFWKGAGIPSGPRSRVLIACGGCGGWHLEDFEGDCREDSERYAGPEDFEERMGFEPDYYVDLDEQEEG